MSAGKFCYHLHRYNYELLVVVVVLILSLQLLLPLVRGKQVANTCSFSLPLFFYYELKKPTQNNRK